MQVKWKKRAEDEVRAVIAYGAEHFGERVAIAFYQKIKLWAECLAVHPNLGFREPLLENRTYLYRSLVVHKHYKLIYYVDAEADTLYIADLWDMRREPSKLSHRIR